MPLLFLTKEIAMRAFPKKGNSLNIETPTVFTLVDGFEQAGYKQVEFDASQIASGIYFYKMHAGSFQSIRKFVLLK